jgi:predicted phosphoadenosine phosphosulfate sulfurtransferase
VPKIGINVFDAALERLIEVYEEGHRVVVGVSGGKDSTCCLELCVIAATMTGRLPVEAVTREEEVIYPGVPEYLERMHERDDVELHWFLCRQPAVNLVNRAQPYWWVCDPDMAPSEWVREPPPYAVDLPRNTTIGSSISVERFPPPPGKKLVSVIGLRATESRNRFLSMLSAGGHLCMTPGNAGDYYSRPIYDWKDGDVWKAIGDNHWDYASSYDIFHRMGLPKHRLRIGPPTMTIAAILQLPLAAQAWPAWWDRVMRRLPGARAAAQYGRRVLEPHRRLGERWRETFERECIETAPAWIAERARLARELVLRRHARHATTPYPDAAPCSQCTTFQACWKDLANHTYLGDPFALRMEGILPLVQPEFFRPGAGTWVSKPSGIG